MLHVHLDVPPYVWFSAFCARFLLFPLGFCIVLAFFVVSSVFFAASTQSGGKSKKKKNRYVRDVMAWGGEMQEFMSSLTDASCVISQGSYRAVDLFLRSVVCLYRTSYLD